MPAKTFSIVVGPEWVKVSDGSFGLQAMGSKSLAVFMGDAPPSPSETQFLIIQAPSDRSFSIDPDGSEAWVKCLDEGQTRVSGWRME